MRSVTVGVYNNSFFGLNVMEKNGRLMLKLATKISASYLSNNKCEPGKIMDIFDNIYLGLINIHNRERKANNAKYPAVPIEKSVMDDKIICLEDGKAFKTLKRHLASNYKMTPEQYRTKWNLPTDYPMVAPSYSKKRRQLAKESGLGRTVK